MDNKVNPINPKNKNFEIYEEKVQSLLAKAASNLFKDKFFHEEFKGVFLFSTVLKTVSSTVSFCTTVLAVHIATRLFFGYYPSLFFAVSVGFCIEGIKTFLWRINSKWTLKYKKVSKWIVCVLVSLHCVSFAFSAYGGWMLPTFVDEIEAKEPVLVKNDSVLTALSNSLGEINAQIAESSAEVAKTSSNSTKRSLGANLGLLLEQRNSKEKEISKIKEIQRLEYEAAKQEKKQETQALISEQESEISTAQISCLIASIFFELLFIICACFGVYYLFRYSIDQTDQSEESNEPIITKGNAPNSEKTPSIQQPEKAPEVLAAKTTPKPNSIQIQQSRIDSDKNGVVKCALNGCTATFVKKPHNKKFCSDECRQYAYHGRIYSKNSKPKKS
jgi:hypothetical protein